MLELIIDTRRTGIAMTAGVLTALLSHPAAQLALTTLVAAIASALASVMVDIIRALGRKVLKRYAPEALKAYDAEHRDTLPTPPPTGTDGPPAAD